MKIKGQGCVLSKADLFFSVHNVNINEILIHHNSKTNFDEMHLCLLLDLSISDDKGNHIL